MKVSQRVKLRTVIVIKKNESFIEGETTVINQSRNSRKMLIEDLSFDI